VLNNLISNAVKFTFSGSVHVTARMERSGSGPANTVLISVKDTGLGIDSSKLHTIFLPFEQVRRCDTLGSNRVCSVLMQRPTRQIVEI
jgi:signal transduction histidine kinase